MVHWRKGMLDHSLCVCDGALTKAFPIAGTAGSEGPGQVRVA